MKHTLLAFFLILGMILSGCSGTVPPATNTPTSTLSVTATASPTIIPSPSPLPPTETPTPLMTPTFQIVSVPSSSCKVPVIVPTAAPDPGYTNLDKSTNLHMTGNAVTVDLATYRLKVTGMVDHPLSLSYDDLRCMPKVSAKLPLICPGFFEDWATWSGVPIKYVLGLAGIQSGAKQIALVAADSYTNSVDLGSAMNDANFLAYEWDGEPLPILHGFPLRAVFPYFAGAYWVKWLVEIKVE